MDDIDETYPLNCEITEVSKYIARRKAEVYIPYIKDNDLVITADTLVLLHNHILGKPKDEIQAKEMLKQLAGNTHTVSTGICITTLAQQKVFSVETKVSFCPLSDNEIEYYISKYQPFDKAGAYGVQEWLGYICVNDIQGSFYNIMGLPMHELYAALKDFC
jgi:septum formation protein